MQMPALILDLLFKDLSAKQVPRARKLLVLPCSRTASPAARLSLVERHIQIFITSPRDILHHVAQDGIVLCAKEYTGLSKRKDSIFLHSQTIRTITALFCCHKLCLPSLKKLSGSTCFQEQTILLLHLVYCAIHRSSLEAMNQP